MPFNPVMSTETKKDIDVFFAEKHPRSICVANYKGGVGKTTIVCLLGYYLAEITKKKVLMFDIDPQCSLSLAVGFNPEQVSKTQLTIHDLVKPSKWAKIRKTNFGEYVSPVPDSLSPKNLYIVKGSFDVENLDFEITKRLVKSEHRESELFLYCKQMFDEFKNYDYILVDCPPNKMYLTQAMLRACSFYMPVTIPDEISIYGMPRLLRWVKEIPKSDKPKMLGYILNTINRSGGASVGKTFSQQTAEDRLERSIKIDLTAEENTIIGNNPLIGLIPRLDVIARFLGERGAKVSRKDFTKKTSNQPTVDECLRKIAKEVLRRINEFST
ncbi:MAG TPA: ParA family protein [Pyrinomonadaceae bacterium]|jgi:chromosome partitioning protein